jgi:hypothetical protein
MKRSMTTSVRSITAALWVAGFLLFSAAHAFAVSCTTQAEMKEVDRAAISAAARSLAAKVQAGDANGVKATTIPSVAGNFEGISSSIQTLGPILAGAALNVSSVYDLAAMDIKPGQDSVQFFCGEAANSAHVIFTIPQLPPGHYAFTIVEATGVKNPQRLSMLLQMNAGNWQLAGFFPRPLIAAGHDGVWYWQKAREYAKENQDWNAYFYFQTAAFLLLPADFIESSNFDKLLQEQSAATPPGMPGDQPMTVTVAGQPVAITNLHTDSTFGGLDLVVSYNAADVSDPVAARTRTVALMKALLTLHPEWKEGFHGLWVFANAPNQHPFALELPIPEIEAQS